MRKGFEVGIFFLLFVTCIIPTTAQNTEKTVSTTRGNWLYVGGSGPGNYSTIQDAINNASTGDIVFVYTGIYKPITVSKSLYLIGENKHTTIINGTGAYDVVSVVGGVTISGFTIQNGGAPGKKYGRGINIQHVSNIVVSNIILSHNYLGIFLYWGKNILFTNITFVNESGGISLWDAMNCTITLCVFDHAGVSQNGFPPSGSGNSLYIVNNLFTNNSGINLGYLCIDNYGITTIESNVFENNEIAITTLNCKGVNIIKNNFINNTQNVLLQKASYIFETFFYINHRQNWKDNYWDDRNQKIIYPIIGTWTIGILFFDIPILSFHYREYDWHPAQEPYTIDVNCE